MTTLLLDYDVLLYAIGFIGEKRCVRIVHRQSGDEYEFNNRSEFYGRSRKKDGGWLAEYNAARTTPRLPEDFDYFDEQTPEPIENCLHTMRTTINRLREYVEANKYYGYSGVGKSFREDISTVVKYKGNRDNSIRPIHLDELRQYLVKYHACQLIQGIEADDACSIDCANGYSKWLKSGKDSDLLILAAVDKDYDQCPAHIIHPFELGEIRSHDGSFGRLWIETNSRGEKKVKGRGRMWLYQQVMDGDAADNYCANSASEIKWGQIKAYECLKDAKNDKEVFEGLVKGYKTLYPEPKTIKGWRGSNITVDWLYMLSENFSLARMLRHKDEKPVDVKATMDKLGVNYE